MTDRSLEPILVACLMTCAFACPAALPSETEAQLEQVRRECAELGQVVEALEARGQGQYSRMSYEVLRFSLDAIDKEDMPQGMTNRVIRLARELARIAPRALAEAKRIASGEERDMSVPRFKSSPVSMSGCIPLGRREWPDGRVEEDKSVMLNGWGHFWNAQRDIIPLNRMGGNFLQREVGLSSFMPTKGTVNTNALDNFRKAADRCLAADTLLDFHLCAHYMAGWATADSPASKVCKNHFMGFCVHDPRIVDVITNFMIRAATLTKDHPGLLSYCLTNEPGTGNGSKCPHLRALWMDWLADRYGTVGRMNDLWETNYVSFADVDIPAWPNLPKTPRGLEFVRCNRKAFADFHESLVKAVKSVAPDVPLHSKLLIDTSLGSPDTKSRYSFPFWSNDGMRFAEMFDLLDHDGVYFPEPKGKWPNRWGSHQMASDFLRSFADKPLMNTENHILPDNSLWLPVSPVHCYSALWQEAIHGLRMSAQWCWQRGSPKEKVFYGLAQDRPECLEAMGRCMLDLSRLSDELVPIQSEPPTVLMMWSLSSMVLGTKHSGCYTAAAFLGEPLGFVTEEFLARYLKDGVMRRPLESARVILLPGVTHLPDESVAALKRLEESGIKILAIGAELGFDDLGRPRGETPWRSLSRKVAVEKTGDLFDDKPSDTVEDIFFELKAETAFEVLSREAANWNLSQRPRLAQPVFGVETHGYEQNGVRRIALCNHLREPVEVELEAEGIDLLTMKPVPRKLTLPSMQPFFVETKIMHAMGETLFKASMGAVTVLAAGAASAAGEASPAMFDKAAGVVRIPEGERLRILQLTDTQIIDSSQRRSPNRLSPSEIKKWLPENAEANCYSHIRDLVAQTCPHLIIMTGDNIYGEFDDSGRVLAEFIGFMDSLGIPWAPVWGNHDQESAIGNAAMCAAYEAASNCLFRTETENPADGTGNYAVRIYQGGKLIEMVYMLDSHGCAGAAEKSIRIPRSITENQCRMMERIAKEAEREAGRPVPGIAAWHIPTKEFFGACKALGYPTKVGTVIGVTVPARPGDFGAILETSIPTATPERFAERLRGCGVNAVFVGHCHKINISVMWDGIRWTMGMKTGTYDYHINGAIGGTLAEFDGGVPTVRHVPTLAGY